jgi:hypothetical protein
MQAGLYLIPTRGMSAPEALICWERAESFCHSLNRPPPLYSALMGQFCYSLMTDTLTVTMQIAKRIYSLAKEQNDSALVIGAYRVFAVMSYYSGDFDTARRYAMRGVQLWRSGDVKSSVEEMIAPAVECLSWIEDGIRDYQATGAILRLPYFLALKAEALHLANRTFEALEAIREAEAMVERSQGRWWSADCTGSAVCFSPPSERSKPKLSFPSAKPSKSQKSRSRFC